MGPHVALGIDTGGTYTDAVLVELSKGEVLATAKALTTYNDLTLGIQDVVKKLPSAIMREAEMVGLSTTLATNAIVEGKGRPVSLALIGYDRGLIEAYGLWDRLGTKDVCFLTGGHDIAGEQLAPLDLEAARNFILSRGERADAFAVSGYYSVRNPAHELEVKRLVAELTHKPVSCGHELSAELDSIGRATTAVLNAQLIPLLTELIASTLRALESLGVHAPLMIVRADGSLMHADMAIERPVETILSGPAASAVGTSFLTRIENAWAVDLGGTTSDLVVVERGRPRLSPKGAEVGGWRTKVRAVDVRTNGIGGDSRVAVDKERQLRIGPYRSLPLSLLAHSQPAAIQELERQAGREYLDRVGEFLTLVRPKDSRYIFDETESAVLDAIREGARSWLSLQGVAPSYLLDSAVARLERLGLVLRAGFTPTDALHVVGRYNPWCGEAAQLGAELLAKRIGMPVLAFCEMVVNGIGNRITRQILRKVIEDEDGVRGWPESAEGAVLLRRILGPENGSVLRCEITLHSPLVAIGAPVKAYAPRVAELLHTRLIIPPHAEVASAIGAVVGSVVQVVEGTIVPLAGQSRFRLHLGGETEVFDALEEAVAHAERQGKALARAKASSAGAVEITVEMIRQDNTADIAAGWGQTLYLGTDLRFTAVGRPAPVGEKAFL